jgi:hypothetical protein
LGDNGKAPNHIAISSYVYANLLDWAKYHTRKNTWGQEEKVDMWTRGIFTYNGQSEYYYYTSYQWTV